MSKTGKTRAFLDAHLRARARPNLDLALLTDAGAAYAFSRTWLIFVRALLRTAVYAAEIWFLSREFPFEFLVPLFALRTLPGLLSGLHWGGLEALRERVRREAHGSGRGNVRATIEAYLLVTAACGGLVLATVTALVAREDDPISGPLGLYGLFAIVTALALAFELWTRTYHAGVFALGRVYRPASTVVAPDLLELAGIVLLFPYLGPFALHVVVLASALFRGGVAVAYARRAYRMRDLPLPRPLRVRSLSRFALADARAVAGHVLATLPLQLDRLLLIFLLQAPPPPPPALPLSVPYYALRPIAAFAQSWVRTFYADFVRLDVDSIGVLRARFERLLLGAAAAAGVVAAGAFTAGAYALFGEAGLWAGLLLVPLGIVRAFFALDQLGRFAYGERLALAANGAVLLVGLLAADQLELGDRAALGLVTLLLVLSLLASWVGRRLRRREQPRAKLPLSAWLRAASSERMPVRVSVARVDGATAGLHAVARTLAAELDANGAHGRGRGSVARVGRAWLLWYEPLEHAQPASHWARALAGTVTDLRSVRGEDGRKALAQALAEGLLPGELHATLSQPDATDARVTLLQQAAALVPEADVIDLRRGSRKLRALRPAQLALVRRAVIAAAREQHHIPKRAEHQVAVYAPAGEPEVVFVWLRGHAGGGALRTAIRHASWQASLRPPA